MFALLSLPYVYPYDYIVAPILVSALVISIASFAAFPHIRKYTLVAATVIGAFEIQAFPQFGEGIMIGFLTLTCVGIMATFNLITAFTVRIIAGLSFAAIGSFLLSEAIDFLSKASLSLMTNLTAWITLFSWASTTLAGGILILTVAFRKRYAIRTEEVT